MIILPLKVWKILIIWAPFWMQIIQWIAKGNTAYYANAKLIKSKFLRKYTKMKIYKTMIRPVVMYSSETWTLTAKDENNLRIFERQILRKRCGPINIDNTRCGNKEIRLLLLLISGHVDDEEEGRALTRGLPSTVTQRFIHVHRLVWPWPLLEADRVSELRRNNAEC